LNSHVRDLRSGDMGIAFAQHIGEVPA